MTLTPQAILPGLHDAHPPASFSRLLIDPVKNLSWSLRSIESMGFLELLNQGYIFRLRVCRTCSLFDDRFPRVVLIFPL